MKGIVFTEFLDLIESKFGVETAEGIIESSDLDSEGSYTSVGTYDHSEILKLVTNLSLVSDTTVEALVKFFGNHLVKIFSAKYPQFFEHENVFEFLKSIDSYIHVEVRKLYPDAELPKISFEEKGNELHLKYESKRPFADLAEGLIEGSIAHFGNEIELKSIVHPSNPNCERTFILKKVV